MSSSEKRGVDGMESRATRVLNEGATAYLVEEQARDILTANDKNTIIVL